ncbi:hypothetical protein L6164_031512 [Bauhinia variegata]|uniref:Uncharacterized protein n=1 Tax=Bauhinia variegata TaxID=167791 RepID=A0ACB9LFN4_BAUVA|nr:hypothetical protein L6164_031512 [Bauhinia variegata]
MASSDEEGEIVPDKIVDYYFLNDKNEPVSIACLPLLWSKDESKGDLETKIFLRGTSDDGLQRIFKQITAWRFEASYMHPDISVLSKDKNWIILQKPRKSFESTIRTVLVTVHWLHFVKRNPEEFKISVWKNHTLKAFSSFADKPSENDIRNHVSLIREVAKRDKDIAKSKLLDFVEKPLTYAVFREDVRPVKKFKFIVDSDEDEDDMDGEEVKIYYDNACSICDNGGEILPCEGRCLRSFHPTKDSGAESFCESLGYTITQVNAIPSFYCENCKYKQHQCFACGKLGSDDVEVFLCCTATCGYFYHPECVAKLLYSDEDTKQEEFRKTVAAGKPFVCPVHTCFLCRTAEEKDVYGLQFAICRRCPKVYHRKCLPREIAFEPDYAKELVKRAWDGLLEQRILMYCMDHDIVKELGTPARNHLIFPDIGGKKNKCTNNVVLGKKKVATSSEQSFESHTTVRTLVKLPKEIKRVSDGIQTAAPSSTLEKQCPRQDFSFSSRSFVSGAAGKSLNDKNKVISRWVLPAAKNKLPLKRYISSHSSTLEPANSKRRKSPAVLEESEVRKDKNLPPYVEADMERRILSLMRESISAFEDKETQRDREELAADASVSETAFFKNITQGKVEGSVKAIRAALNKLDQGGSIEDAKAICAPEIVNQIYFWQKKLKVYLATFIHGKRYTSFGRHFTNIDKLKEVVDRLHWYVKNGDTVVDFCCGSNDFSCLMKAKLEQMGKVCSFKNYDLFQAKNDFGFEKGDWMTVKVEELPNGSQLIMGLNPPFGINGYLANKFIEKALEFKPKLLILIVPKETKRLDRKKGGYDLIWEDAEILSGKSFYLPGSIDVHNKQLEDWNLQPPPLSLWSRPDWTLHHMEIALNQGHVRNAMLFDDKFECYQQFYYLDAPVDLSCIFDGVPEDMAPQAGTSNPTKLKQTLFPDTGRDKAETFPCDKWDCGLPYDAGDTCVDMDISSQSVSCLVL